MLANLVSAYEAWYIVQSKLFALTHSLMTDSRVAQLTVPAHSICPSAQTQMITAQRNLSMNLDMTKRLWTLMTSQYFGGMLIACTSAVSAWHGGCATTTGRHYGWTRKH